MVSSPGFNPSEQDLHFRFMGAPARQINRSIDWWSRGQLLQTMPASAKACIYSCRTRVRIWGSIAFSINSENRERQCTGPGFSWSGRFDQGKKVVVPSTAKPPECQKWWRKQDLRCIFVESPSPNVLLPLVDRRCSEAFRRWELHDIYYIGEKNLLPFLLRYIQIRWKQRALCSTK